MFGNAHGGTFPLRAHSDLPPTALAILTVHFACKPVRNSPSDPAFALVHRGASLARSSHERLLCAEPSGCHVYVNAYTRFHIGGKRLGTKRASAFGISGRYLAASHQLRPRRRFDEIGRLPNASLL